MKTFTIAVIAGVASASIGDSFASQYQSADNLEDCKAKALDFVENMDDAVLTEIHE